MQQNMEYIYTIYETGSIRKAALQLRITQPALSIALRKTEEELGEIIFDRSAHPMRLTPAGEIYLDAIRKIRHTEQNMRAAISDLTGLNTGALSVGGTQYFNSYILPRVYRKYMELYPNIDLKILEARTEDNARWLLDNQLDLMLSAGQFESERFTTLPIAHNHLLLIIPRSLPVCHVIRKYSISRSQIISGAFHTLPALPDLHALEDCPFIALPNGSNIFFRYHSIFSKAGVTPRICMQVEQLATAHYMACNGIGAALTTNKLIEHSVPADVMYFKIDSEYTVWNYAIILKKNRYTSNACRQFIKLCQKELLC